MTRSFRVLALFTLLACIAVPANATTIIVSGDSNILNAVNGSSGEAVNPGNQQFLRNVLGAGTNVIVHDNCAGCTGSLTGAPDIVNNYYNSVGGVTSSLLAGAVTAGSLAGANLFVSILPASTFTAAEIAALSGFGGDVFFLGENGVAAPTQNGRINAALAGLGSSMTLLNTAFDSGFQSATGAQIAVDPYTAGITLLRYAAPSEIAVTGGTALFFGKGAQPFVAYSGKANVPEAASLLLVGLGVAGLSLIRRKQI